MPGPAFRTGETVSLHPVEETDLPLVARLQDDPDVRRTMCWHRPQSGRQVNTSPSYCTVCFMRSTRGDGGPEYNCTLLSPNEPEDA
jgi:hypothetical protein